ncbi:MAG: peptidylprolyl isomerase [Leptolyngbyaceae bacterium]|nr:peptidylprolyl isomerase [Leptolyngbyaceae bacterium]
MTVLLQVHDRSVTADEIIPLLTGYQLLPQLLRELIVDQAIAPFTCTPEEQEAALKAFYAQNQITSEEILQAWLKHYGMTPDQVTALATRELRINKFKQATWGTKLESHFLNRKAQLDKVVYSLIRTQEVEIAQELYFRLQDGEQSFAELAQQYSKGPEGQTGGLVGPTEMSAPHPVLVNLLTTLKPGQISTPTRVGEWLVIVRLEKLIPAQFDEAMQQRLMNELFSNWLQEQVNQLQAARSEGNR